MKKSLIVAFFTLILTISALAGNKTFTGPGNFSDPTKWNGNVLPVAGDNLKINNACTYDAGTNLSYGVLNLGNPTSGQFSFNSGTTLTVTGISSTTAGSSLSMTNGGTLVLSSTTGWPTGTNFTPGTGTVIIQGAITLPTDVSTFNNLTIAAGASTVTLGAATTVNANLTITSGTLSVGASNFALNVKGNWTNSGTFTTGTGTVTFNGSSAQGFTGATTFNNLTLNNSAGLTLSSSATVNGTLTLTNGLVTTGANTMSIASTGSVSLTNGYVVGNLRKNVATGAPSQTFEIGDASNYTPVSLTFASVTTAGNLTATTTPGDHPNLGTSTIDPSKSVNRYWTLTNAGVVFTNYNATFTFTSGDVDAGASTSNFSVGNYNPSTWTMPTVGTKTSTSTQATGVTTFGDFAIGEVTSYTITASAGVNGSISPSGAVNVILNGSQSFTITPNTGYHVADVLVDGVSVGAVTSYNFTTVTVNHTIDASFAINTYSIAASAGTNGSISPNGKSVVNYGDSPAYTITPNTGYHVADVLVDGVSVGSVTNYTFTSVSASHTIDASFAINTYSLSASAGANGSINPNGKSVVNYGDSLEYTMTPNTGYHIADVLVDGVSVGAVANYEFTSIIANHTIDASFGINTFSITTTAETNGAVSPNGKSVVNYGDSLQVTITPNTGYHVADVLVDGVSVGAVTNYTFTTVTANHTLDASFAINTFSIAASAGPNGSIGPKGKSVVNYGDSLAFTMTPNPGYHVSDVLVDGVSVGAVTNYTFTAVAANHTISASFSINTFSISASAGANGSISPAGKTFADSGSTKSYTITPNTGYHVADVLVDGVSVGAVTTYDFTNINASHTISAAFAINTYSLSATAGPNGLISPKGKSVVNYGDSLQYTITPNTGYFIADVHVDTVSVGPVSQYTFTNITANHTISATFSIQTFSIAATAGAHGSISPAKKSVVNYGDTLQYTITADKGYFISDVHVDTVSVGPVSQYTFINVTANHTIDASFSQVVNNPPSAPRAFLPVDHDTVFTDQPPPKIDFVWHPSVDPDVADSLRYSVHIYGAGLDTTVSGIEDTTVDMNIVSMLQPGSTYQWTVAVTDGHVTVASSDSFVFFATTLVAVKEEKGGIPKVYALHQNYPNPFNPTTTVQFDLPRASEVTLTVYNILGQEVEKLINHQLMSAGYERMTFDAGNIPSGIYFYRIEASDMKGNIFKSIKKMMVIK